MTARTIALAAALVLSTAVPVALVAQPADPLVGSWKTSSGAIVNVGQCASELCLRIATLSPTAPGNIDHNNPDPALRDRPLCNMVIGSGFTANGTAAAGGHIYDPLSGKTYKATFKLDGNDTLKLHGFIGVSFIGRTETWTRTTDTQACTEK